MNGVWMIQILRPKEVQPRSLDGDALATVRIWNAAFDGEYLDAGDDSTVFNR